jgi:hypothetical protein
MTNTPIFESMIRERIAEQVACPTVEVRALVAQYREAPVDDNDEQSEIEMEIADEILFDAGLGEIAFTTVIDPEGFILDIALEGVDDLVGGHEFRA